MDKAQELAREISDMLDKSGLTYYFVIATNQGKNGAMCDFRYKSKEDAMVVIDFLRDQKKYLEDSTLFQNT